LKDGCGKTNYPGTIDRGFTVFVIVLTMWCCSNSHLFGSLKQHSSGRLFNADAAVLLEVHCLASGLSPDFYFKGVNNIISQWNKYLNGQGHYVEK
jgi:hypothetical protein